MDKAHRHEIKMLKFKKRLSNLGLTSTQGNFFSYRSHGKPCSCSICSPNKCKQNGLVKKELKEIKLAFI